MADIQHEVEDTTADNSNSWPRHTAEEVDTTAGNSNNWPRHTAEVADTASKSWLKQQPHLATTKLQQAIATNEQQPQPRLLVSVKKVRLGDRGVRGGGGMKPVCRKGGGEGGGGRGGV